MKRPIHISLIVSLFVALFFSVINFTITIIASPYIVADLGGDDTIAVYDMAFFGFGSALTIPLARPLAFDIKKIFPLCMLASAIASLMAALAPTYVRFTAIRLLMGMASGPLYSLLAHYFSEIIPPEKKKTISWIMVTILIMSPVLGASWGGTIAYLYNWRAIFFFNVPVFLILAFITHWYLQEVTITPLKQTFDWLGWGFYSVGLLCLTFVAATVQQLDWYRSPLIVAAFLVGVPTFIYALLRCFYHASPVLSLRLLEKPLFSLALLCLIALFSSYFGMIVLLSLWLNLDAQFTPLWIGALVVAMGISGIFPRFIITGHFSRFDPRYFLGFAAIVLAISCFYTTQFDSDINFGRIVISRILAGLGLAFFLPPIFRILGECYAPSQWTEIFELFQTVRNLACSLGAAIFSIVWQRRTVFYHERLGEKLNLHSYPIEIFFRKVKALNVPGEPLAQLNYYLDRRSSSLALDDVFFLLGWILMGLFVLLVLTFFFRKKHFNLAEVKYSRAE
jgi:DHA2 family multidrug resistance protein